MPTAAASQNFLFLRPYERRLDRLGALAERYFRDDPAACLITLRRFGDELAHQTAARVGLLIAADEPQSDLLRRLSVERAVPAAVLDLFHQLCIVGNRAAHQVQGDHRTALTTLGIARELAIWFHRSFGPDPHFTPGPFVPPAAPPMARVSAIDEMEDLRGERDHLLGAADDRLRDALARESAPQQDAAVAKLLALQGTAAQASPQQRAQQQQQTEQAARHIELAEPATRAIIDAQLRARGWAADTQRLRYRHGARPVKGQAMAIAEWPTASGPADYALFYGLQCLGTVEAKRKRRQVSAAIDQAERYAREIADAPPGAGPWGDYRVPFVFATNGRPYLKQIETESGIWFRDTRKATNQRRALTDWPTPEGLTGALAIDCDAAQAALKAQPMAFGFHLRPYQGQAITVIERELARDRRAMLIAMATGTGKTKLAIALLYRLLTAKRFRRVCFVVDRSALGRQTGAEFSSTRVVGIKTFADIFDLKGLTVTAPDPDTKVHICTIQGLVRRVFAGADSPPIDHYDLIVIDECHRGYLLDRELSDGELSFRSEADYISKYRRVLEHFDAVKIGLTATPALHTVQIFGDPIYTYSYREAVIDGYLIDHEPPVRITTALAAAGIHFARGAPVERLNTRTGEVDLMHTPDAIAFQVEAFNKQVVTVNFNKVVAVELARHIDPNLPGKTLVFAATDAHADILVDQLKTAFAAHYGEIEDGAIRKITGSVDKVGALILSYRNDALPKIAVTVDLLTTGIDVPKITNLVFLRRVNSRILYEQMLGRATRRCDEIGKETFRIFDAVDLYPHLQHLTEMRPVVVNPSISLTQLCTEFLAVTQDAHRAEIRDQILVKLRRRLHKLSDEARAQYAAMAGETPEQTLQRLAGHPLAASVDWLGAHPDLGRILDWDPATDYPLLIPISHHEDRVTEVAGGYGNGAGPQDFLDGFTRFIRGNLNHIAALTLVVQRPRELTRAQLRELRLALDGLGYCEANLRRAWRDATNEEIAASIIGFVRQAALGDALIPFATRVRTAMQRILAQRPWTDPQRKWLNRIAEQVERELVVDRESLNQEPFQAHGGFNRLNKVFDGQLETVLSDFNEALWRQTG